MARPKKQAVVVESNGKDAPASTELVGIPTKINLTPDEIAELERPRAVVKEALSSGNMDNVFLYGNALDKVGRVAGLNKAQILFLLRDKWATLTAIGAVEDDWENVIQQQFGMTPSNSKKYADAWQRLVAERRIPDQFVGAWLHKPVESWLAIKAAAVDGLTKKKWEEATAARLPADVKKVVRSVRGTKTSAAKRLVIQLKRKTGELRAWRGNSRPVVIGMLKNTESDRENEVLAAAVDRIIAGVGIVLE